jgi:hypothetical protein
MNLRLDGMVRLRLRSVFAYGSPGLTLLRTVFAFCYQNFYVCVIILRRRQPDVARESEDWHPLRDRLINKSAPLKYALSTIQTLFAEINK